MDDETRARISLILAEFDGREVAIADAGRENTKTANRVARLARLNLSGGEKTFRRNVAVYKVGDSGETLEIGAERAGGGVWRLIAHWTGDAVRATSSPAAHSPLTLDASEDQTT